MLWSPQLVIPAPKPAVAAGGGGAVTWNPSDKTSGVVLSGSNLIATTNANTQSVRSTAANTAGQKVYFEVVPTVTASGQNYGMASASAAMPSVPGGDPGKNWGFQDTGLYRDQTPSADDNTSAPSYVSGDNVGIAFDDTNHKVWLRVNGGNWLGAAIGSQNPATNTGGKAVAATGPFYAYASIGFSTEVTTAKFASSDWTYAAPSGFTQLA